MKKVSPNEKNTEKQKKLGMHDYTSGCVKIFGMDGFFGVHPERFCDTVDRMRTHVDLLQKNKRNSGCTITHRDA